MNSSNFNSLYDKKINCCKIQQNTKPSENLKDLDECPICFEKITNKVHLKCKHEYCLKCCMKWFSENETCPFCRTKCLESYPNNANTYHQNQLNSQTIRQIFDHLIHTENNEQTRREDIFASFVILVLIVIAFLATPKIEVSYTKQKSSHGYHIYKSFKYHFEKNNNMLEVVKCPLNQNQTTNVHLLFTLSYNVSDHYDIQIRYFIIEIIKNIYFLAAVSDNAFRYLVHIFIFGYPKK